MFQFPLIKRGSVLLNWSYHVEWHTPVKKNLCAVLRKMWSIPVSSSEKCGQKVCSKGVILYETTGTGSCDSSEELEKMDHFRVNKLRWCGDVVIRKKFPRARRISKEFLEWHDSVKCENFYWDAARNGRRNSSQICQADLSLVVIVANL